MELLGSGFEPELVAVPLTSLVRKFEFTPVIVGSFCVLKLMRHSIVEGTTSTTGFSTLSM